MKYEKVINSIQAGKKSRADLIILKRNAEDKLRYGDTDAQAVIDAINNATPKDSYILFMGFCPSADFSRRLDVEWKKEGVCCFEHTDSEHQIKRFNRICKGDLVVLKKREKFGKTMKLYGYGRVISVAYDEDNLHYLNMKWSEQERVIEVPLMGCNSTVDIKSIEQVEDEMPESFYSWLEGD